MEQFWRSPRAAQTLAASCSSGSGHVQASRSLQWMTSEECACFSRCGPPPCPAVGLKGGLFQSRLMYGDVTACDRFCRCVSPRGWPEDTAVSFVNQTITYSLTLSRSRPPSVRLLGLYTSCCCCPLPLIPLNPNVTRSAGPHQAPLNLNFPPES